MAHDVFISYSVRDKAVADAVCATLESRKIRCWIAPRDVLPGKKWVTALIDAIGQSRAFVLVLSDGANRSPQVLNEVGEAVDRGIPIIPFRIEDVPPSNEMGYYIKAIHWLDALTPPLEAHLSKLADTVQALISPSDATEAGATRPEAVPKKLSLRMVSVAVVVVLAVIAGRAWVWPRVWPAVRSTPTQVAQGGQTPVATAMQVAPPAAATTTSPPSSTQTPVPTATPVSSVAGGESVQAGATKVLEPSGITMVYVPAGEFLMGSAENDVDAQDDEKPQHVVYLDGYWIGQTEVTNAQYGRFIEAGGYSKWEYWTDEGWQWRERNGVTQPMLWSDSKWNEAEYPAVGVSRYEAEAYAKWAGARLPTEAEWEYAARGGPLSGGFKYAGSNSVDVVAWYQENSGQRTHPVAGKKGNELGLYDMSGNVFEWAADRYDAGYYQQSPRENPSGPSSGGQKVLRGGSWLYDARILRCAVRWWGYPAFRGDDVGFRVAE